MDLAGLSARPFPTAPVSCVFSPTPFLPFKPSRPSRYPIHATNMYSGIRELPLTPTDGVRAGTREPARLNQERVE